MIRAKQLKLYRMPKGLAAQFYREGLSQSDNPYPRDTSSYRAYEQEMGELEHEELKQRTAELRAGF